MITNKTRIGTDKDNRALCYAHNKCDTCQREKNWQTLNRLPDSLRRAMQKETKRVDSDKCRLTKMSGWEEAQ